MDTALLKLSPKTRRDLNRSLNRAAALSDAGPDAGEALARLISEARMLEACAAQASNGLRLPGRRGTPRVLALARRVLNGGEAPLTKASLLEALDAEPLTMAELWAAPQALRVAITETAAHTARAIVRDAAARASAQRWIRRALFVPKNPSPAFCEQALTLCAERGARRPRMLLEGALRRRGTSPDFMVRQAHAARAHQRLRLENLSAARRLLDALDWQTVFETLSEADAELRRDPAGVYPLMDDASRQRVRDQVAHIARATRQSERAVAEQAVTAARRVRGLSLNLSCVMQARISTGQRSARLYSAQCLRAL